jgi:hypothetical protein
VPPTWYARRQPAPNQPFVGEHPSEEAKVLSPVALTGLSAGWRLRPCETSQQPDGVEQCPHGHRSLSTAKRGEGCPRTLLRESCWENAYRLGPSRSPTAGAVTTESVHRECRTSHSPARRSPSEVPAIALACEPQTAAQCTVGPKQGRTTHAGWLLSLLSTCAVLLMSFAEHEARGAGNGP